MTDADQTTEPRISAVLLAGGRASRFGGEKGLVAWRDLGLAERVLAVLDEISDDVWISTNRPDLYDHLGRPMVGDVYAKRGPLGGLHAALRTVAHPWMAAAACDMPFVSATLYRYLKTLTRGHDLVVPSRTIYWLPGEDRILPAGEMVSAAAKPRRTHEPLHALYHHRCLSSMETLLGSKRHRLADLTQCVRLRDVPEAEWAALPGVTARTFENINTPEDLRRLQDTTDD